MRLHLLCVSRRPAGWVTEAGAEYLKRLKGRLDLQVRELSPATASQPEEQRQREAETILKAVPAGAKLVALDERGLAWSTAELANELAAWRDEARDVALVIGGAEGLAESLRQSATRCWSLSRLTLPHQFARVLVIEQIYRAYSLLNNHPYHRA
jgi:23S rRNA (pseudouridine1915-N3)-methyltransferase